MNRIEFNQFISDNIVNTINNANSVVHNSECIGYDILIPNFSINTMECRSTIEESEQFDWDWFEIEQKYNITMMVSDYDDLVIYTDQYEGEF